MSKKPSQPPSPQPLARRPKRAGSLITSEELALKLEQLQLTRLEMGLLELKLQQQDEVVEHLRARLEALEQRTTRRFG
jgi:hypothetical protein